MKTKWLTMTALCLALCGGAMGQMSSSTGSNMVTRAAVPDIVAYRAWFEGAANHSHPEDMVRATGLNTVDQEQLLKEVINFAAQMKTIKDTWKVSAHSESDHATRIKSTQNLTNQTNKELQALLSADGWTKFQ